MQAKETLLSMSHFSHLPLRIYVNRATETFNMPLHAHDFIEFAYVAEGRGFHYIGNAAKRTVKGELFIIPIGVPHVFRPVSVEDSLKDPLIVYNCVFTVQMIDSLLPAIADPDTAAYLHTLRLKNALPYSVFDANAALEKLFLALHEEYYFPQTGGATYLSSLLLQLLVATCRLKSSEESPSSPASAPAPARFLKVIRYMERHFAEELTLSRLTRQFQWSERHLQRLFKQHTGQTFNHFLQNLRIQKSCEQLRNTQLKISGIAAAVGYKDLNSFTAVFKRIVGQTPSGYRHGI